LGFPFHFQAPEAPFSAGNDGLRAWSKAAVHFIFTLTYERLKSPPARIVYSFATARTQFYPHQFKPLLKFLDMFSATSNREVAPLLQINGQG
jgi:hypothetical protein